MIAYLVLKSFLRACVPLLRIQWRFMRGYLALNMCVIVIGCIDSASRPPYPHPVQVYAMTLLLAFTLPWWIKWAWEWLPWFILGGWMRDFDHAQHGFMRSWRQWFNYYR